MGDMKFTLLDGKQYVIKPFRIGQLERLMEDKTIQLAFTGEAAEKWKAVRQLCYEALRYGNEGVTPELMGEILDQATFLSLMEVVNAVNGFKAPAPGEANSP